MYWARLPRSFELDVEFPCPNVLDCSLLLSPLLNGASLIVGVWAEAAMVLLAWPLRQTSISWIGHEGMKILFAMVAWARL